VLNPIVLYVIIGVVGLALIAGAVIGARVLWKRQVRRSLISLTGRREALGAAWKGLQAVFIALAAATPEEMAAFATEPEHEQRKALEELHGRMVILADDLKQVALPKALWRAADLLGIAADTLAKETGRVGEATSPVGVLDALGDVDVAAVKAAMQPADIEIDRLLQDLQIADPSVYGGGLYI
jgi:hypothetical protein